MTVRESETARVALVSGGNRGIGFATCRGLAELGLRVALGARDPAAGAEAIIAAGPGLRERMMAVQLDVTDEQSVRETIARIEAHWGRLDVLVNNAAVYLDESERAVTVPIPLVRQTLETNFIGALRLCQSVVPNMVRRRYGRIVNVSSGYGACAGVEGSGVLAYKASKLALNALTRVLAAELKGSGVLVNATDPGWVRTRMGGRAASKTPEQGAATALWLATLPADGPTGGFFRNRRPVPW